MIRRIQYCCSLFLATALLFLSGPGRAQNPGVKTQSAWNKVPTEGYKTVIKFGPMPTMWQKPPINCWIYDRFVVTQVGIDADDTVTVFTRDPKFGTDKRNCEVTENLTHREIFKTSNGHFSGVSDPYLFMDEGTSLQARTLHVFNLNTGKETLNFEYSSYGKDFKLNNHILTKDSVDAPDTEVAKLKNRPKCPKRREDQRPEGSPDTYVGWREAMIGGVTINLKTNTRTYSNIRCELHYYE